VKQELSALETDLYIWNYTLLVVHTRNEEEEVSLDTVHFGDCLVVMSVNECRLICNFVLHCVVLSVLDSSSFHLSFLFDQSSVVDSTSLVVTPLCRCTVNVIISSISMYFYLRF